MYLKKIINSLIKITCGPINWRHVVFQIVNLAINGLGSDGSLRKVTVDQIFGQLTTDVRKSHVLVNIEIERRIFIVVRPHVIGKDLLPLRAFIDL